ncbi:kielin/chordin-like protein [Zootermopsis nevadensis]|uniref:VWFC domain-containing protein n=1 Tax=Zootermopsis nevadensis TaxID=136037 RepID=A0A067R4Y0_ZOONE|nr:kielin/chordin-like protein [Zootermopsis nevadensis]KDR18192.1 hypothetical protein L798_06943 [Zootermopsis nevadensis]
MLQRFSLVILALAVGTSVKADECSPEQCVITKHYNELGCTPVFEEGSCCPNRFDCSSLFGRDSRKCYYKGVAYDVHTELHPDATNRCTVGCRCNDQGSRSQLTCVNIECPELFQGPLFNSDCFHQYTLDRCCSTNTYCRPNNTENLQIPPLHECQYGGTTYREGQMIYPEDAPCKQCICQRGFNETLAGPWCQEISCGIELHYSRRISDGCVPVYYGRTGCCPIDWRCPDASDSIVASVNITSKNAEHKCKFGQLELRIGDKLSGISNRCVHCSCVVPPLVSCTQKTHTECRE